jgi:hypothetical protein
VDELGFVPLRCDCRSSDCSHCTPGPYQDMAHEIPAKVTHIAIPKVTMDAPS